MKHLNVIHDQKKLTQDEIDSFEKRISCHLPADYKTFLSKHNGGHPLEDSFEVPGKKNWVGEPFLADVAWFLAIYEGDAENIEVTFSQMKDRLPQNCLPIAFDSLGNIILLDVGKQSNGKVHFWDHEAEDEKATYLVANSFTDFINGLFEYQEEA